MKKYSQCKTFQENKDYNKGVIVLKLPKTPPFFSLLRTFFQGEPPTPPWLNGAPYVCILCL